MENFSIWEERYQDNEQCCQPQNAGAAASAASSPGRRARTSPPQPTPWNVFTHQGKAYRILRLQPGDCPSESIQPHQPVAATIHAHTGTPKIQARATARTPHLVHVIWDDEEGETYGTWLPNLSVQFYNLPPNNSGQGEQP